MISGWCYELAAGRGNWSRFQRTFWEAESLKISLIALTTRPRHVVGLPLFRKETNSLSSGDDGLDGKSVVHRDCLVQGANPPGPLCDGYASPLRPDRPCLGTYGCKLERHGSIHNATAIVKPCVAAQT